MCSCIISIKSHNKAGWCFIIVAHSSNVKLFHQFLPPFLKILNQLVTRIRLNYSSVKNFSYNLPIMIKISLKSAQTSFFFCLNGYNRTQKKGGQYHEYHQSFTARRIRSHRRSIHTISSFRHASHRDLEILPQSQIPHFINRLSKAQPLQKFLKIRGKR